MKALVTGATGFIGSHLVERLLDEGMRVACLIRPRSDSKWLDGLPLERYVGTLDDPGGLAKAARNADYVFHLAGLTRARSEEAYLAVNAEGTRRLLEAVQQTGAAGRRFVYVSSLAAVGPNTGNHPLDETADPHPLEGYGASKLAAERIVLDRAEQLPVTIIRPPAVYGPRDTNFLPLFRSARRFRRVPIVGKETSRTSFVYVRDLVEGIYLAACSPAGVGQTYFIGSGTHDRTELVRAVAAALNFPPRCLRIPPLLARLAGEIGELKWTLTGRPQIVSRRKIRDALQPSWTCSWQKAREELGYCEQVKLTDGIKQTAEWYIRHGWLKE